MMEGAMRRTASRDRPAARDRVDAPTADLARLFARAMERHASRPLFGVERSDRSGGWEWTPYGAIGRQATALAAALGRLGVKHGDRVAILSSNRAEWAVALGASLACGAVLVPMYEAQLEKDWRYILEDAAVTVCFVSTDALHARIDGMRASLPALRHVISFDREGENDASLRHLIARATPAGSGPVAQPIDPESLAAIIYTSGTTGAPKGVELTHVAFTRTLAAMQTVWSAGPHDRTVSILPWAHVGGFFELFTSIESGCAMALPASLDRLMGTIVATKPTSLVGVPRIWNKLYDAIHKGIAAKPRAVQWLFHTAIAAQNKRNAGLPLGRRERVARRLARRALFPTIRARLGGELRFAITGAAALSRDVAELMEGLGITVIEVYGQTEVCAIATANRPGDARLGTVGKPLPGVRITIDRSVATTDDGSGEVLLHSPGAMRGYHGLPGETAAVQTADGGIRTGDLGRIDARGFLTITGRVREVYKLENGKFVSPAPIEEALTLSPYIAQAMVHGLNAPHNVALLVLDAAAIRAWCGEQGFAPPARPETDARVRDLVAREIALRTSAFKGYERVKGFTVIDEEWTTANDMLTPSMKLKRRNVLARYRAEVDALYR
jgi:long-chain acyl-CoA synthetase